MHPLAAVRSRLPQFSAWSDVPRVMFGNGERREARLAVTLKREFLSLEDNIASHASSSIT
jgi:hypothetical protein